MLHLRLNRLLQRPSPVPTSGWVHAVCQPWSDVGTLFRRKQVAIVGEDNKFRVLTASEVSDYLEEVE